MGTGKIIDVHEETAKILAQILTNDKALAILHALEDRPKSISELAAELGFPISTVSYHIDRMLKVGLVEVAGVKYGKKLQEVKLYRASSKPILLVPRKEAAKVTKRFPSIEKLHVISLAIASLVSALVYETSRRLLFGGSGGAGAPRSANLTYSTPGTESPSELLVVVNNTTKGAAPLSTTSSTNYTVSPSATSGGGAGWEPLVLAVVAFLLVFLLSWWLLRRRTPKRF